MSVEMMELMNMLAAAPATGDDFPAKKLIAVLVIAVGVMVLLGVFAVVAGKKEDDEEDKKDQQDNGNNEK